MSTWKDIFSFLFEKEYIEISAPLSRRKSIRKIVFPKTKKPLFTPLEKSLKKRSSLKGLTKKTKPRPQAVAKEISKPKEVAAGEVTHFFEKIQVAVVKAKKDIAVGDKLRFKGLHTDFIETVKSMQIDHKDVAKAKKGEEFGLKLQKPARVKDTCFFV